MFGYRHSWLPRLGVTFGALLALGSSGCASPAAPTSTPASPDAGGPALPPPVVQPVLSLQEPVRGAWVGDARSVLVVGSVREGTAPVESIEINRQAADRTSEEAFFHTLVPRPGVNLVGVRVEAEDSGRAVDGRAFFAGTLHPADTLLRRAARLHLGWRFLDDNEPDLDDVAALAEMLFTDPTFLDLLDEPYEVLGLTVQLQGGSVGAAAVDITPGQGSLFLDLELRQVALDFTTSGLAEATGTVRADAAWIVLDLELSVVGGAARAAVSDIQVELSGFSIESDFAREILSDAAVADAVADYLEGKLEELAGEMIAELIAGLLDGFAFEVDFGETSPIQLALVLDDLQVSPQGLSLDLDVRTSALQPGPHVPPDGSSGSLATDSAPLPALATLTDAPVAMVVDDDVVNQVLYAVWASGMLTGVELLAADLSELGAVDLPDIFEPLRFVRLDGKLPMAVTPGPADAADGYLYDLALGELLVDIGAGEREFGLSVNLSGGVRLAFGDDELVRLQMDPRPAYLDVHAGVLSVSGSQDPGSLAALVRTMLPPIIGRATEGVPGFPIPTIGLADFTTTASLQDKEIVFLRPAARMVGADGSLLLVEGEVDVRTVTAP